MFTEILSVLVILGSGLALYMDVKKKEIEDWLTYGMIIAGLLISAIWAYFSGNFLLFGVPLLVGLAFFGFGALMFYTGNWGGGDAKLLAGIGIMVANFDQVAPWPFALSFLMNLFLIGSIYGIFWSIFIVLKNWKKGSEELQKLGKLHIKNISYAACLSIVGFFILLFVIPFVSAVSVLLLLLLVIVLIVLLVLSEKIGSYKLIPIKEVTDGDWIGEDVTHDGKVVLAKKEICFEEKTIENLKKLGIKKVLIKQGIPFAPVFFIAFIVSLLSGDLIYSLIQVL